MIILLNGRTASDNISSICISWSLSSIHFITKYEPSLPTSFTMIVDTNQKTTELVVSYENDVS